MTNITYSHLKFYVGSHRLLKGNCSKVNLSQITVIQPLFYIVLLSQLLICMFRYES